jgi:hypothetical protein
VDEGPFTWNEKGEMVPLDTRERIRLHRAGEGRPFEELPYKFGPIQRNWSKIRFDLALFLIALGGGWVGLHHFAGWLFCIGALWLLWHRYMAWVHSPNS